MDTKKKNLIGLIIALISFIIVLVMYVAVGIGLQNHEVSAKLVGWGSTSFADIANITLTFTDYVKIKPSGIASGIAAFSIIAFVFVLLLTVYFAILTIASFMGKELMSEKAKKITGLVLSIGLILFALLFMISSFSVLSFANNSVVVDKKKLTGVSYITMFFPIICGAGLVYSSIKLV